MKWKRFLRLLGKHRSGATYQRDNLRSRFARRPSLEVLESRELLSNDAPFIKAVVPLDGSTLATGHPNIQITFSENVVASEAQNTANYLLFKTNGTWRPPTGPRSTSTPLPMTGSITRSALPTTAAAT